MWDPDGVGPMLPVLVVGGNFTIAGTTEANNIVAYDPASGVWSALGSGVSGGPADVRGVYALTTLANGDLVVGGMFNNAGGTSASNIARWNGTSWAALGAGMPGPSTPTLVSALTTLPNGDLVAGGMFQTAGGTSAASIAQWNGISWSALGPGLGSASSVRALTTLQSGDLVAGGTFVNAGGVGATGIARWNGTTWSSLGSGMDAAVNALTTLPGGDLVAGGAFNTAGGVFVRSVARWNGTAWSALGSGMNGQVFVLATLPNGDVVAGGDFTFAGGVSANLIARWNGTNWSPLGPGPGTFPERVSALTTLPNGGLVASGQLTSTGNIAVWNGANWSALGSGPSGDVLALAVLSNGDLVAGGRFTTVGGVVANHIARWNGTSWSTLGSGMNRPVTALATLANGDLVAGGYFTTAGGVPANLVARWDGTSWSALGSGITRPLQGDLLVNALVRLPNGDLVVGGRFSAAGGVSANSVARWDGTNWSALGYGFFYRVYALTVLANGDVVAGSQHAMYRWNGTSWSPSPPVYGGSPPYQNSAPLVFALTTLANGDIVAGGSFANAGGVPGTSGIARWDGVSWATLGGGMSGIAWPTVYALTTLPNGDLIAGGWFATAGGVAANCIARWDGTSWSALDSGLNNSVFAFGSMSNGDVVAGGKFTIVDSVVSAHLAQLSTTCPASAASSGTGCTGSGGLNVLAAASLPWTGSTFRSVAMGMPANALAIGVRALTAVSIPLQSILPQGVPGCSLFVNPDVLDLYVPTAGTVQTQMPIPNTVVLAGQVFHQQVVPVELDAQGNIIALTSTNRLTLTIGTF